MTHQKIFRFLTAIPPKIGMQQIHHRPEMPPFLHIDLEQVPQIKKRRACLPKKALLFYRSWLRIALCYDQTTEDRAIFAGDLLPHRLTKIIAKTDGAVLLLICEKDAPAIFRHLYRAERRPSLGINRGRRAKIDIARLETLRSQLLPPVKEARLPVLKCPLEAAVITEIDIVGDSFLIVYCHPTLSSCQIQPWSRCRTV